jgi:hypothetical protein
LKGDKAGGPKEIAMDRLLPRLATVASLGLAAGAAFAQAGPSAGGPPSGTPGGYAPPGGLTGGITGNTPGMADQIDEMNRHINGERQGSRNSSAHADRARPATATDIIAGATVADSAGIQLGTIESVDASGAVILTAVGRARIPVEAFGKNSHGLLLQTTKAQFDASVASANATPG